MKKLLFIFVLLFMQHAQAQVTNTFLPLVHFPGTPSNPCVLGTAAQNDSNSSLYICSTGLTWVQVGGGTIQGVPVSTTPPQTGDTLQFNVFGDGKWDVTSSFIRTISVVADGANVTGVSVGSALNSLTTGTVTAVGATATEPPSMSMTSSSTANTSIVVAISQGTTAGTGRYSLGSLRRYSVRLRPNQSTNIRAWVGLGKDLGVGLFSGIATDTPNTSYCAFRFSAGVDTTWKAICGTSNVLLTIVDTGIAIDTANSQLFEFAYNAGTVNFFLSGLLVAQISTNVPTAGETLQMGWGLDNKNTANIVSSSFSWMSLTFK